MIGHPLLEWLGDDWSAWADTLNDVVLVLHGPTGLHVLIAAAVWEEQDDQAAEVLGTAMNWATAVYRGEVTPTIEKHTDDDGVVTHKVIAFDERWPS